MRASEGEGEGETHLHCGLRQPTPPCCRDLLVKAIEFEGWHRANAALRCHFLIVVQGPFTYVHLVRNESPRTKGNCGCIASN